MSDKESSAINSVNDSQPVRKSKNRWCCRIFCFGSAIFFTLILSLLGMLATSTGQRLLVEFADKLLDALTVESVSGSLAEGLELHQVRFQTQGVETLVDKARLQLDFSCLWERKICIDDITINKPQVTVDTNQISVDKEVEKESKPIQRVTLPLAIEIKNAVITGADVKVDNTTVYLANAQTEISLNNDNGLTLGPTQITGLNLLAATLKTQDANVMPPENEKVSEKSVAVAAVKKTLAEKPKNKLDLRTLEVTLRQPILKPLAEMKAIKLPFDFHIVDLQAKDWQYQDDNQHIQLNQLQLQADLTGYDAELKTLYLDSSLGQVKGYAKLGLNEDFPVALSLSADINEIKQTKQMVLPKTSANIILSGNLLKQTALSLTSQGGVEAKLNIKVELNTEKNPLNISLQSKKLQYPLSGEPDVRMDNINLLVSGDLLNYHVNLKSVFKNKALSVSGRLGLKNDVWALPDFKFTYGNNLLEAKGNVQPDSQKLTAKVDVNAPDLSGLLPELNGSVNGKLNFSGKLLEPNVDLDLIAKFVQFQGVNLQNLVAKGKVTSDQIVRGDIAMTLAHLSYGEAVDIRNASLELKGSEQQHELHFKSEGKPVTAVFNIVGGFDRTSQVWQGSLSNINIKSFIGDLKNTRNIALNYDNKKTQAMISAHCWQSANLAFCFPEQFKVGKEGEIPFDIKRLDLKIVNQIIGQDNLLQGKLSSQGNVTWFINKTPIVNIKIDGKKLGVTTKVSGRNFNLPISKLGVIAQLENNNLISKTNILLEHQASIDADLNVQDIAKVRNLNGGLNIRRLNLHIAKQLLSNSESITGYVSSNLKFSGSLNAPLLNGSFNVSDIQAKLISLPFMLQRGNIALRFYGRRSVLQGAILTDQNSQLNLEGDASWQDLTNWYGRIRTRANEFYFAIPGIARVKVSPDVTVKVKPTLLELFGQINVPWARIAIESLPESAVTVSDDEVILGENSKNQVITTAQAQIPIANEAEGMAIKSDLKISIGDDVSFDAYGLKTKLKGLLSVQQEKGKLGLYGQVDLVGGRFASFGQDLLIHKGQISFSGIPSQPFLNVEAIRNPDTMEDSTVTAGVKVTGSAGSPEIKVFSEPSLPQDQALSYILTGRSLENSGETGSAGSVGAALLGMGISKSGKTVGKIGEHFGITDLNVGTSGVGDNSKVTVSGNITDRLQIKYGVGLFNGLAEVTLRYRLLPRLYLQSISGVNQAFDLLYQFQF